MSAFLPYCGHTGCGNEKSSVEIEMFSVKGDKESSGFVGGFCIHCGRPITARVRYNGLSKIPLKDAVSRPEDVRRNGWNIDEIWPGRPTFLAPEYTPEAVATAFVQAERNYAMKGMDEPAATFYRKAIDLATKAVANGAKENNLSRRIEKLAEDGHITKDLKVWADSIRIIGNEGAHDEGPMNRADLEDIRTFCELTLIYIFTLPGRMAKRLKLSAARKVINAESTAETVTNAGIAEET